MLNCTPDQRMADRGLVLARGDHQSTLLFRAGRILLSASGLDEQRTTPLEVPAKGLCGLQECQCAILLAAWRLSRPDGSYIARWHYLRRRRADRTKT